jgi:hypothetical protein
MICTIYSHHLVFDRIVEIVKRTFSGAAISVGTQDEFSIADVEIKGGLFSSSKKMKVSYRQRTIPSYQLPEIDDSPLTRNLKGLYGFVSSLPARNEKIKGLFLHKIQTLNCEFSVIVEKGEIKELKSLIATFAKDFDAILFVQPNTVISRSSGQHFVDKDLRLIIDGQGNSEIDTLDVSIDSVYFDASQTELSESQKSRKERNEQILQQRNVKVNRNLPCIEDEHETVIRSPREIATRVSILAFTNLVAFGNITGDDAIAYLKQYKLWDEVTPNEKEFLADPTDARRNQETWKCECIWVLMWALNKVSDLGFPDELCSLNAIAPHDYPIGQGKDPNNFINAITSSRTKEEILDANDLYYRIDWACVDARINNQQIAEVNASVVYERHYALNWLVNYMDQAWDDVSCDT